MKQHFLFVTSQNADQVTLLSMEKNSVTTPARNISINSVLGIQAQDHITLVLSDQLVSNYELNLTARNQQQLQKAARYAVEEKFPGRLEDYHIVVHKRSKQKVSVRAIQLERLENLLAHLHSNNITPNEIFVESDLLNHNVSTLLVNSTVTILCGNNLEQAYEFDTSLVPMIGQKIFTILGNSPELQIIYPTEQNLIVESLQNTAPDKLRIKKILKDSKYYESLSRNHKSGINLLHGAFDTNGKENNTSTYWRYPVGLTAAYILIFTGGLFAQNIMLGNNLDKQEINLTENYLKTFPGSTKPRNVNDLANKLRSRLSDTSANSSAALPIRATELIRFSAQASNSSPIRVMGITLDSNSAELLVAGESIERLDTFKNTMQSKIGSELILNMDSVSSKDEQYQGKISIRNAK